VARARTELECARICSSLRESIRNLLVSLGEVRGSYHLVLVDVYRDKRKSIIGA